MRPATATELAALLLARGKEGRLIVAIAGPPGVGKSTFAADLRMRANMLDGSACEIVPMDGYHLDDMLLEARGWRARKGAPHTFDVRGLGAMLARLKANEEDEIFVPVFDRAIEIARAGARAIGRTSRIILVEGNYLLLGAPPWPSLACHFDLTVMLRAPRAEIHRRLLRRWTGFGLAPDIARMKVEENDMPNADMVLTLSSEADYVVDMTTGA